MASSIEYTKSHVPDEPAKDTSCIQWLADRIAPMKENSGDDGPEWVGKDEMDLYVMI